MLMLVGALYPVYVLSQKVGQVLLFSLFLSLSFFRLLISSFPIFRLFVFSNLHKFFLNHLQAQYMDCDFLNLKWYPQTLQKIYFLLILIKILWATLHFLSETVLLL